MPSAARRCMRRWPCCSTTSGFLESLVGETINNYTITRDDVENALRPVYAYVDALLDAPGAEFFLEQRVDFPTIAGAFGTCDLIVRIGSTVHVVDFKFGAACACSRSIPMATRTSSTRSCCSTPRLRATRFREFFAGVENIVLTILQPMSIDPDAEMMLGRHGDAR